MNKKLAGILICIGLLISVLPVSGIINYDTGFYWNMMQGNNESLSIKQPPLPITGGRDNLPPYQPHTPFPANESIDIDTTVLLTWVGGDPDGNPVTYDVFFGTINPPAKVIANQSALSYDPGILDHKTVYYWQIVAWDNQSAFNASPVWEFTTRANTPPIAEADGPYSGYVGDPITLDGSGSTDPDGSIVLFEWDFESDGTYDWSSTTTGVTTHSYASINIYTATIRVTDDDATNNTDTAVVNVTPVPNYPPNIPSNPMPMNGSIDIDFNEDLQWTGGDPNPGDIVTYDIYFGNISTPPLVANNHTDTTYDVGTMIYDMTYYWQIIAWDNNSLSTPGPQWSFTVESETNHPPFIPTQPDPQTGALNIPLNQTLSWIGGDPDGNPVTYNVYFGTNTTPSIVSNNQTTTSYDPGNLNSVTTYYWYIIAWDNQSLSTQGPLWEFTTKQNQPPAAPTTPNPNNGSTGVNINVDLEWTCSDPDNDALTYDVFFGTSATPPKIAANITMNTYDPGTLVIQTTYYWQIVAWDPYGGTAPSQIWRFTTQANSAPTKPIIISGPVNAGPGILLNFSAIATDPENDPIFYRWDWGDGNITDWQGPYNISDQVKANYTWYFTGDYQIKVQARDNQGAEGPWSDSHNITIAPLIHITNLQPGFLYFSVLMFNRSYAFIYALSVIGLSAILTTTGLEIKASADSAAVDKVIFESYNPVWDERITATDTNLSNGIIGYHSLSTGIWEVTAYAYDADGTMIDLDETTVLFLGIGSGGSGQTIGHVRTLRERVAERLFT